MQTQMRSNKAYMSMNRYSYLEHIEVPLLLPRSMILDQDQFRRTGVESNLNMRRSIGSHRRGLTYCSLPLAANDAQKQSFACRDRSPSSVSMSAGLCFLSFPGCKMLLSQLPERGHYMSWRDRDFGSCRLSQTHIKENVQEDLII